MAHSAEEPRLIAALKQAVRESGLSLNELARQCGVSPPQLSRFMRDERSLTLDSAAKLFDYFGLGVVVKMPHQQPADEPPAAPRSSKRK